MVYYWFLWRIKLPLPSFLFYVGVFPNNKLKSGWEVKLIFAITLHKRNKNILEQIKNYFGVGNINDHGKNIQYHVNSLKDLSVIINHFEKYYSISQKQGDYFLFKRVFYLIKAKEHLTPEGLQKIVAIKALINRGLS